MKNILIAERYPLLREALRVTLEREQWLNVEGVAESLADLEQKLLVNRLDILLLDTQFDHANTSILHKRIQSEHPQISILLLSVEVDPKEVQRAISLGAAGILLKSVSEEQLLEAMHQICCGITYIHEPVRNAMMNWALSSGTPKKKINCQLTQREQEVLQLITEEYTSKEIAKKLYISHCTVETHRLNLIQKLGVKNTAGLVREAIQLQLYQQK